MIADDEETVRDVLLSLLNADDEISVVGAGQDADEAIAIAVSERPDVALLDVRMPRGGGPRAAREITRLSPGTEVIALSADDDPKDIRTMLRAGAGAYLVKGDGTEDIVELIHRSVEGSDGRRHAAADSRVPTARPFVNRERRRRIEALVRGEGVDIVYQPIFDLRNGRPVGAEALGRFAVTPLGGPAAWFEERRPGPRGRAGDDRHPARGRRAGRLEPGLTLAVNASPETCCSPELRELVESVEAERLVLEITEHAPWPTTAGCSPRSLLCGSTACGSRSTTPAPDAAGGTAGRIYRNIQIDNGLPNNIALGSRISPTPRSGSWSTSSSCRRSWPARAGW